MSFFVAFFRRLPPFRLLRFHVEKKNFAPDYGVGAGDPSSPLPESTATLAATVSLKFLFSQSVFKEKTAF